jgi:hypothetical protein
VYREDSDTYTKIFHSDEHLYRAFPANTLFALQRRPSLAFGYGTFAYAKDQASLPLDGLLKEYPPYALMINPG